MSQRVDKDSLPLDQPRRTPNHPTKSHIVKTKVDGKEKIIRFGEQGASTAGKPKAGESDRMKQKRASFKARHAKNIAKGKSSPAYWANKVKWAEGGEVKMARGGSAAMALLEQMRRSGQSPEFNAVEASLREQRMRPRRSVVPPPQQRQAAPQAESLPLPPVPPAMRPDENPPPEAPRSPRTFDEGNPFVATAIQMAERYGLPRDVFLSLVRQESNFNPAAVSPRGAIGLGQLMPGTARELGVDPNDPVQNLEGSARYLRQMLDRFGDMPLALAAYNAGPTRVALSGNTIPNIRETQNYVQTIMRNAGASGFAEGGLAELNSKYADDNVVTAYDPDAVEARIRSITEPEGYAEGGEISDGEYDRRLLSRMKEQTGRVTEPTRAEQMQALRTAGREAGQLAADVLLPQSPLDAALMVALGPGGRAARLAGAGALAALEPSEAEASRFRRLVRAYHGSPHKFDEFDIRKIGSGEGAQAYGRGLYFAENEDVARSYRDKLSPLGSSAARSDVGAKGLVARMFDSGLTPEQALEEIDFRRSLPHIGEGLARQDPDTLEFVRKLDEARDLVRNPSARGHMYEVDLNASPREFLNWDARLSQQAPEVRESLERFNIRVDPDAVEEYNRLLRAGNTYGPKPRLPEFSPDPTGQEIYQRVLRMDPEEARIALMQSGIPGTRYLDAGSRGVGGSTHNYAVFDPEIIDIRRRYAHGGLADLEQKYSEGGSADSGSDGGGSSDDSGGASTSDATSSVSDAIGAGYGPESSGYGNQGGPGPNASMGMSVADPEGTSQAANMSTAMSAQNAGLGYGIADTGGVAPTGFSNAPSLAEAASAFSRGDIGFQQALGLGLQSAFSPPGVQIGTMTDALGLQSQAASINPVGLGAGIAGTALGLATGIPGLGLAAGYLGSKIGDSLGIAPSIVSYTPGEGPVSNVDTGGETNFLYPNYVERLGTDLASLNQKYAEGGQVSIAQYNPAAVDALVKKIEAEYV